MSKNLKDFAGLQILRTATNSLLGIVKGGVGRISIATSGEIVIDPSMTLFQPLNLPILQWVSKTELKIPANTILKVGGNQIVIANEKSITVPDDLDTGVIAAGKDYCVYIDIESNCHVSLNTSFPSGFLLDDETALSTENILKIGGFHTLCYHAGVLTVPGFGGAHPLSGYNSMDILPLSVWALNFRPWCDNPAGMVYLQSSDIWVDIYNASGTIAAPETKYIGTRLSNHTQYAFQDGFSNVGKRLLNDREFWEASIGSNQKTNIASSTLPPSDLTGGSVDIEERRMISSIGCEEMCGLQWQWLSEVYSPLLGASMSGVTTFDGVEGTFGGAMSDIYALVAGGAYDTGVYCGSRCRTNTFLRGLGDVKVGSRGCSPCVRNKY